MKNSQNKNLNEPAYPAKPTKPQTVRNTLGLGGGTFKSGVAPAGGFQAVWNFSDNPTDYKNSPSTKPEKGCV